MSTGITGTPLPDVAWCKTCKVGRTVVNASADDKQIGLDCGHGRDNPLRNAKPVCLCEGTELGWTMDCPLPEHYMPPKGTPRRHRVRR